MKPVIVNGGESIHLWLFSCANTVQQSAQKKNVWITQQHAVLCLGLDKILVARQLARLPKYIGPISSAIEGISIDFDGI